MTARCAAFFAFRSRWRAPWGGNWIVWVVHITQLSVSFHGGADVEPPISASH